MKFLWKIIRGLFRLVKVMGVIGTAFLTVGFIFLVGVYLYFAKDLPNIQTVSDYRPLLVATVYGSDGSKIGEFWNEERRLLVDKQELPPLLIRAFLAAEDARFFEHRGVDFRGTLRAFMANLKAGSIVQGGSTITQQVTRSLLLSRQRSYLRKIKEAILATRLERYLSKEQILHLYLNQIYFGNRAYGVKAAAENYFQKDLQELNLAEMALLAALPRAPESYSPLKNTDRARERQSYVLDRLLEEKAITEEDRQKALQTENKIYVRGTDKETNLKIAPYFTEYLRTVLLAKYGEETLYYGGLKIYTPLDPAMQTAANQALQRGLEVVDRRRRRWQGPLRHVSPEQIESEKKKIAQEIAEQQSREWIYFPKRPSPTVSMEPGKIYPALVVEFQDGATQVAMGTATQTIPFRDMVFDQNKLAYPENFYIHQPREQLKIGDVIRIKIETDGSVVFYQEPILQGAIYAQETPTGFIKALVGGYDFTKSEFNRAFDALRQPGSSFKPIIYAAALDKGYTLGSAIADSPFSIPVGNEIWTPKNYDGKYRGMTTVHNALVYSYNVATARMGYHIRLHYLTAYARKLGLTTPIDKYPSMTLGANGVHLHEMVAAYATFPNLGVYRPPVLITKIVDQNGKVLEEYIPPPLAKNTAPITKNADELNTELFKTNQTWIETDQLELFPSELKVLYGENIPAGRVMTPQTATLLVKAMSDVVQSGTGFRVKRLGRPVAGKTGTTNDSTDTWFIGYTPELAAGVWVGYDQIRTIGKGEQGSLTAAPIFLDFMQEAMQKMEPKEFAQPQEIAGKDILALAGGSAKYAEYIPMSALGLIEGGTSEDRAADFLEADFEGMDSTGTEKLETGP